MNLSGSFLQQSQGWRWRLSASWTCVKNLNLTERKYLLWLHQTSKNLKTAF